MVKNKTFEQRFLHFAWVVVLVMLSSCTTNHYYIVRHADRDGSADRLTASGLARAKDLGDLLREKGIRKIYSTDYQRTRQTATPLSEYIGVPITIYGDPLPVFVTQLKMQRNSLVVGHSNTVPAIVREMGLDPGIDEIPHQVYDKLFIVKRRKVLWGSWQTTLESTRYGVPTP